ncbi:MAG: hypothetical protein FJ265_09990 [Planctomycetes bacterium]|nr:hypothetical protein [Planctomycetota bacterium]
MPEPTLHGLADLDRALARPRLFVFVHARDSASTTARAHFDTFRAELPDATAALVDAVASPDLARDLAARCGSRHPPPLVVLFEAGRAVFRASGAAITLGALHAAWAPRC